MAATLRCKTCDGQGVQTVLYTGRPYYDEREEPCEDCGGSGTASCVGCGDPAVEEYDGGLYCALCAESEREWDAPTPAAEVRP